MRNGEAPQRGRPAAKAAKIYFTAGVNTAKAAKTYFTAGVNTRVCGIELVQYVVPHGTELLSQGETFFILL